MTCGLFNRPVTFGFCFTVFLIFQVSVGIYIGGVLTTLEKQFRITSSVAGLIVSTSDFASLVSIIGVTYVGKTWHRPRIVGVCAILTGVGGVLSGLPHFIYPAYRDTGVAPQGNSTGNASVPSSSVFVCDADRPAEECSAADIDESGSRINEMWCLFLGQAIMGLAYGPLFPIALTYLDDQVKGTTTPYYIGVFLTASASSTIVGFGQAYLFLTTNVNWPAPPDYTKEWIGAWWLGFILDGFIIFFISVPFFFFPKEMDVDINEEDIPPERLALEKKEGDLDPQLGVKDFFETSKRVVTNGVFMMILCSVIFELAVSASFGFFLAKFLEIRYNMLPSFSALLVGIIVMPGALIGNLSSGIIVKKLKLTSRGCATMIIILTSIVTCLIPVVYFLSCPEPTFAGYEKGDMLLVENPCNTDCECTSDRYEPVCGGNGMVHATPCLAGCTGKRMNRTADPMVNITIYTGCTCSAGNVTTGIESPYEAVPGKCLEPCNAIYYAGVVLFCVVLFGSMNQSPLFIFQIRTVGKDKTFALGISAFFSRAIGFLPAPLYFGAAIEGACILERDECGVTGDCLVYSSQRFSLTFLGIFFGLKICNLFFYTLSLILVLRRMRNRDYIEQETKENFSYLEGVDNSRFIQCAEVGTQTYETAM